MSMIRSLRSFFGRKDRPTDLPQPAEPEPRTAPDETDLPNPGRPAYVVGDVHGRADLVELLLELIDAHIGGTGAVNPQLVFVGDYIDLGPDSAETLARMRELTRDYSDNVVCLMGNHERMMLDFLADPVTRGPRWLRAGGLATLSSFRVDTTRIEDIATARDFERMARDLEQAMPSGLIDWLGNLPLFWQSGNLWAVHAGADPVHPMNRQSARVLLWGHPEFEAVPRADGSWVAYGHAEIEAPFFGDGRIALDTGAWRTGRLTACALRTDGRHDFLQT